MESETGRSEALASSVNAAGVGARAMQEGRGTHAGENWEQLKAGQIEGKPIRYEIHNSYPYQVRDIKTKRIIHECESNMGYVQINIYGRVWPKHRLVAIQWIPNADPSRLTEVNHRNHIRTDNRVENLEWITHADNIRDRKPFRVQEKEWIPELPNTAIKVENYNGFNYDRYWWEPETEKLIITVKGKYQRQGHWRYRYVLATPNGKINSVSLTDTNNSKHTTSYGKLVRYLKNLAATS